MGTLHRGEREGLDQAKRATGVPSSPLDVRVKGWPRRAQPRSGLPPQAPGLEEGSPLWEPAADSFPSGDLPSTHRPPIPPAIQKSSHLPTFPIYLPICPSIYPLIYLSIHPSVYPPTHLSIDPPHSSPTHSSNHPSTFLLTRLSTCPLIIHPPSLQPSITHPSTCPHIYHPFVHSSISRTHPAIHHPPVHPSSCLLTCPSTHHPLTLPPIHSSTCPSIYPPTYPSTPHPSIHPLTSHPPIHPFIFLPT